MGLLGVTAVSSYVVHWMFAMKYWSIAHKLELMKREEDPDKHNTCYMVLFLIGIVLNTISGCLSGIYAPFLRPIAEKDVSIATAVFVLPLILSCLFLFDAFSRFRGL
jgi:hypothetical protein